jgi:hypothetical protein
LAHLAGALAKKVWVILAAQCDWRWLVERQASPWYPSARLFRQKKRGSWEEVFRRVTRHVQRLIGGRA